MQLLVSSKMKSFCEVMNKLCFKTLRCQFKLKFTISVETRMSSSKFTFIYVCLNQKHLYLWNYLLKNKTNRLLFNRIRKNSLIIFCDLLNDVYSGEIFVKGGGVVFVCLDWLFKYKQEKSSFSLGGRVVLCLEFLVCFKNRNRSGWNHVIITNFHKKYNICFDFQKHHTHNKRSNERTNDTWQSLSIAR